MWQHKRAFLLSIFFLMCFAAAGQTAKTPFSAFGIGEYYGTGLAHNQGMGVGLSNPQSYYTNNMNPALLVFNKVTSFSAGILGERRTLRDSARSERNISGNINYLVLAMPIEYSKWVPTRWSMALGLQPYSEVNYRFSYTSPIINSTNTVNVEEVGSGGINQAFWSNAVSLTEDLSIGVKAAYLFSAITIQTVNQLANTNQAVVYNPLVYQRINVRDFNFTLGLSYHRDSVGRRNHRINAGLIYDFTSDINAVYYQRLERSVAGTTVDSTVLVASESGSIRLPQTIGAGFSVSNFNNRWTVGVDAIFQDYRKFSGFGGDTPATHNAWRLALGAEYTPDPTSLSTYLKRITYRTGVSLNEYPYLINGTPVRDLGINFGFSLPVNRGFSSLDFAAKVGQRGSIGKNRIEESYFKLYFGMTFNDQWFIKRRFD
jgi:hypothetical protein